MKNLVLVLMTCAVALTACSSKKKTEEAPVIEQKATTSKSIEKLEKKKAKKAAAAAAATTQAAPAESATTSTGGGFDSYTGTEKASHSCVNKGDTRKITVLSGAEGGCGVVYNKMGEDKTVAVAKADVNHCDTVANKMKGNLEAAGFDCGGGTAEPAQAAPAAAPAAQPAN